MRKRGTKLVRYENGLGPPLTVEEPIYARNTLYFDPELPAPVVREVPTCRTIEFYGELLSFVPSGETYWLSYNQVLSILCLNPEDKEARYARDHIRFVYAVGPEMSNTKGCMALSLCYIKLLAGHLLLTGSREGQPDRAELLLSIVGELQRQAICFNRIHSHTLPISSHRLRNVLDDNPVWEDVLTLWNRGKSQGEIAEELSISVTKVKSAVQRLEYWGFDVVRGKLREHQKETDGNFLHTPSVTRRNY